MFDLFNEGLLRHPQQKHNPCYRKIISYSYFRSLKENTLEEIEAVFNQMIEAVNTNRLFLGDGYLEIYPATMDNDGGQGCVVVDPSRGCFPLVVYPASHTQFDDVENKTRMSGFRVAIQKLQKNRSQIFALLNEHDEWTLELEAKLEKLFEYPKKRSAANSPDYNDSNLKKSV